MYLKSIEIQGFKSFANKIVFEFHNGITGIVGPNGSGKSNVADAVRWVLGEQSAKQLRGAKMEDVIFAGTEARKPVGFAYVSITFDNADHALPIEYNEVTVTRKVFRSGESEYQMNGHSCRLKDITELFYDTGIGKEGYSIIGQGQIDKILSGKPEERRELFDEAAGIVKFKRRKAASIKKLENERENLVRVNDILAELEKQVGPLEKQSEKAKEYLKLKADLKVRDVNAFLLESDQIRESLKDCEEKTNIANNDLSEANAEYESTKAEYDSIEQQLTQINTEIDVANTLLNNTEVEKQRLDGVINVYAEQIKTIEANNIHYNGRLSDIDTAIASKNDELAKIEEQKSSLAESLSQYEAKKDEAEKKHDAVLAEIEDINRQIEEHNNKIIDVLNEKNKTAADNQKYQTMLEQQNIKKAELSSSIIRIKSDENAVDETLKSLAESETSVDGKIASLNDKINNMNDTIADNKAKIADLTALIDKEQNTYHREKSKLESLVAITERYDGYGNSIRKIMDLKETNPGILGVIADIVKVEKKYETAIETALGGSIQNVVTDNENTAKGLIAYLKENKLGRATFLPITSVSGRNTLENDPCMKETGVVGLASDLVRVSFEYTNLAKYLLGRILVVDNIDNALAIARKYKHSLRIVTLEGEQLNPGGSMTGGAFKNASNLLGRRREIEELKVSVADVSKSYNSHKTEVADLRKEVAALREQLEISNKEMREVQIEKNTLTLNIKSAQDKKNEINGSFARMSEQVAQIEREISDIEKDLNSASGSLASLDSVTEESKQEINALNDALTEKKSQETESSLAVEKIKMDFSSLLQKESFIEENRQRIENETNDLQAEKNEILEKMSGTNDEIEGKNKEISDVKSKISVAAEQIEDCRSKVDGLKKKRNDYNDLHKVFFDKRDAIAARISDLDKEVYRLGSIKEKLDESMDNLTDYMWNEYELTYSYAAEMKDENFGNLSTVKKEISSLKSSIKALGDVNVNAIEEYKEVNERYQFLKTQHDDLIEAESSLIKIIEELDNGMRVQFAEKFEQIKVEFDKVFKELFGGGRGTIELVEGEDILEAGITIISQPPGKKLQNMMQLSGGEKALTAISLLFAIQNLAPSPFCLLDEIEAALDDSNVSRYANYLHKLTKHTQFIVITHRRGTMSAADRLYGITMQEKGVSALVSVDLIADEIEKEEKK
jgi:chromosome segregation protein